MARLRRHFEVDLVVTIAEVVADDVAFELDSGVVKICRRIHRPVCCLNVWADVWACLELWNPIYYFQRL